MPMHPSELGQVATIYSTVDEEGGYKPIIFAALSFKETPLFSP